MPKIFLECSEVTFSISPSIGTLALVHVSFPLAHVFISAFESHLALAFSTSVYPLALIFNFVEPNHFTLPMHLSLVEISSVSPNPKDLFDSFALFLVVNPVSLVSVAKIVVLINVHSFALSFPPFEATFVNFKLSPTHFPLSFYLIIIPVPFVLYAVGPDLQTFPVFFPLEKRAFVGNFSLHKFSFPFEKIINKFSFISFTKYSL
jgi:hypothetical protein